MDDMLPPLVIQKWADHKNGVSERECKSRTSRLGVLTLGAGKLEYNKRKCTTTQEESRTIDIDFSNIAHRDPVLFPNAEVYKPEIWFDDEQKTKEMQAAGCVHPFQYRGPELYSAKYFDYGATDTYCYNYP